MHDATFLSAVLDSLKGPVLVADDKHVIIYMNKAAAAYYEGGETLLGTSVLDCHNAQSCAIIHEIWAAMQAGEDERLFSDEPERRVYMRAVRAADGRLLGYYERYEPAP